MQVEWDGNTEQQRAVKPHLFTGGRGMHILAEGEDHPNSFASEALTSLHLFGSGCPLFSAWSEFYPHFLCLM